MNKLIFKIAVLFITVSLVSCEKGLMTFDNANADIYFAAAGKNAPSLAYDSTYVSFGYTKSPDSVRNIIVAITGSPMSYDRTYKVLVNPSSTAVSGIHFDAMPEKLVIKKNTQVDTIKLKLLRTPEMQTQSFFITLDLLANENFGTNFKTIKISGKPLKTISTKILFNDVVRMPKNWSNSYFGVFSRKKLFFMCDFLEITPQYMDTDITLSEVSGLGKIVQRHLDQLRIAGNPVYEDDGVTLMTMGSSSK